MKLIIWLGLVGLASATYTLAAGLTLNINVNTTGVTFYMNYTNAVVASGVYLALGYGLIPTIAASDLTVCYFDQYQEIYCVDEHGMNLMDIN